ncbi:MAG: response regulator transcription factor [Planctomycetota bacterium]
MSDRPLVMVVEDDREMNELECELLQIHGMATVSAFDGAEAVDLARERPADAVLLDIMLPEMDGFECCRHLKGDLAQNMPVIIVTALDTRDSREQGLAAGADAVFTKPFDPQEIVDTVRRLIAQVHEESSET